MGSPIKVRFDYPDTEVLNRVKDFLFSRHFPSIRELDVNVDEGIVTLSGRVQSYYEKQIAMNSCQHVAGVLSMIDKIVVEARSKEAAVESRVPV